MHPAVSRILKILKKLFIILLIAVGSLLLTGTILFLIYRDSIQQAILDEVNKHLTVEVRAGKIRVSFLSHFPMLSVTMKGIRITSTEDTSRSADVLQTDELSMRFNIMDVLHGKYTLEVLKLSNASINLMVFEDGSDNFHFWEPASSGATSTFSVELREVILQMVDISWQKMISGEDYAIRVISGKAKGNITEKKYELSIRGDFIASLIRQADVTYLQNREFMADVHLNVNDRTFRIRNGLIRTGQLTMHLNGMVTAGEEMETDLAFYTEEAPVDEYMNLFPPQYLSFMKNVAMAGNVSTSVKIKGRWNENRVPDVRMDFQLNKGSFKLEHSVVRMENILAGGSYSLIRIKGNDTREELRFDRIKASLGDGWVEGSVRITDLDHPFVSLMADADIRLRDLSDFIPMDRIEDIAGRLNMKITLKGPIRNINKIIPGDLLDCSIQGDARLNIDRLLLKQNSLNYHDILGTFRFDNQLLTVQNLSGSAGTSNFQFQGVILNYLPKIFSKDELLIMDMSLTSGSLNLGEILNSGSESGGEEYRFSLPTYIRMNLDVALQDVVFHDFSAKKVKTKLVLRNRRLTLNDLSFTSMGGTVTADLDLSPLNDQLYQMKCNARLTHVDIQQMFHDFGNFNQTSLTDEHLRGFMDAEVYYTSSLSTDLSIDKNSLYTLGQITVSAGELIGYTPLYKLSGLLDIEDLKHIRFSELNNLIEIRKQTIIIPQMEIKSNTLDLTLYGTHTFSNQLDYHLSLLLSQLLVKKVKPDTQKEFGVVKEDGMGRSTLFIAVTGTADQPKFSYDRPALKEKLARDLKKERQEIKVALQDEFSISKKDDRESEQMTSWEKGNFILEWEYDSQDSIPRQQEQKKIRGPKFDLTWEDEDTLPEPRQE